MGDDFLNILRKLQNSYCAIWLWGYFHYLKPSYCTNTIENIL